MILKTGVGDFALEWSGCDADLALSDDDLRSDEGLKTAVLLSLFTDRRAEDDDVNPDGTDNRRGWWGDEFSATQGDRFGSRLWLLDRSKRLADVAPRAEEFSREALAWMLEDRVASRIEVEAQTAGEELDLAVTLFRPGDDPLALRFANAWDAEAAVETVDAAIDPLAMRTASEWLALHPTLVPPVDIAICDQIVGGPKNTGGGPMLFDSSTGFWSLRQPFSLGGFGMRGSGTARWFDSVAAHAALGSGPFTILWIGEIMTAPAADLDVCGKRSGIGDQVGVGLSFRNDGQIIGILDGGPAAAGFENLPQGSAAALVAPWAIGLARDDDDLEYIMMRKAGGPAQISTPTARADNYDDPNALWSLGDVQGIGTAADANHRGLYRFEYGLPFSNFTAITAPMSP